MAVREGRHCHHWKGGPVTSTPLRPTSSHYWDFLPSPSHYWDDTPLYWAFQHHFLSSQYAQPALTHPARPLFQPLAVIAP